MLHKSKVSFLFHLKITVTFLPLGHLGSCSWLGATLHLRQKDGGHRKDEVVTAVDHI